MNKLIKVFIIPMVSTIIGITGVAAETIGGHVDNAVDAVKSGANSTKNVFSDQNIEHNVNNVLSAQVPNGSFTVASYYGHVLLAGQVPNDNDKNKAENAVKNTDGVKTVWNYLTVGPNEDSEDISKDAMITTKAKNILLMQKGVNSSNIKVVTCHGVVYLLGKSAGKARKLNSATKDISQIDGVSKVIDLIGK